VLFDVITVSLLHLEAIAIIIIVAVALHIFLTTTKTGRSMRAVSDNPELARVAGLDTEKVVRWTWIIGGSLAAIAGVLSGLDTNIHPNLGWNLILPMFAAAILGGIGKPMGALLGGMVIALIEELSSYTWITDEPLINPGYKTATAFLIMVLLLIFRPQGLLKGRVF
jgi:branched-chain amino acid transport system permease protein